MVSLLRRQLKILDLLSNLMICNLWGVARIIEECECIKSKIAQEVELPVDKNSIALTPKIERTIL